MSSATNSYGASPTGSASATTFQNYAALPTAAVKPNVTLVAAVTAAGANALKPVANSRSSTGGGSNAGSAMKPPVKGPENNTILFPIANNRPPSKQND